MTKKIKDMDMTELRKVALKQQVEYSTFNEDYKFNIDKLNNQVVEVWGEINLFEIDGEEWLVLTDDEADKLWDEELDNYIDDCLCIPKHVEPYFDREKWKSDARMDGRGHAISSYDGMEHNQTVGNQTEGQEFFLFRMN